MKKGSIFQIAVHIGSLIPLVVLGVNALTDNLTINPIQAATQRTGDTAIILLLLSLACTPINTITGWSQVLKFRRPLGLYAFLYAFIHYMIFIGLDFGFNIAQIIPEFREKNYLLAGLAGLIILTALALTSWRWWMKKMGKNWKRLHRLVYLAGFMVVLHVAWVVKGDLFTLQGDIWKPLLAGVVLTILLIIRIPFIRKGIIQLRQRIQRRSIKLPRKQDNSPAEI